MNPENIRGKLFVSALLLLLNVAVAPGSVLAGDPAEVLVGLKVEQITGIKQKEA